MKLVFVDNNQPVTDSLTVAEVFNKNHADVLRDIRNQIEKLNEAGEAEWGISNFAETHYLHSQNGQTYPKFNLTEDAFAIVAMAYVTPEAMKMKIRFLAEFKRMRDELNKPSAALPQNYKEALLALVGEVEKNEALQLENEQLRTKVKYVDQILISKGTMTITQIAKDYGLSGPQLNKILHEEKVQYKQNRQWLLYQKHSDKGYTRSETIDITRSNGNPDVTLNTRWTQKGRLFIHELLAKRDIVPYMDRQHKAAQ